MEIIIFFANSGVPQNIQISTVQSLVGLGAAILAIGIAWGTLKTAVNNVADSTRRIEQNVTKMSESMATHKADITGLKAHTKYGISNSPMQPSDEGGRVLQESGFNNQYPKLKEKIFQIMDEHKPRTLYDYEVGALEALHSLKNDPLIDPLKDYAVNHPDESLDLIFKIASWVIRDDYAARADR